MRFLGLLIYFLSWVQKWLDEDSGCLIESVDGSYIHIFVYNLLAGGSYVKFSKELWNPKKRLIGIWNKDNGKIRQENDCKPRL